MSYSLPEHHRAMFFDETRNGAYARALEALVTPRSRVMDLGAGLGVHGLAAARMGAASVHMVEPASVIRLAEQLARVNELDNVVCHEEPVEALQLDAPMDIIISVFTGNFLLNEDLLPLLFQARDRFLAPGGVLLPDRARMWVAPVSMGSYYQKQIGCWRAAAQEGSTLHGLDTSLVADFACNNTPHDNAIEFDSILLAEPVQLAELDFYTATSASCDAVVELELPQGGECHGWLGWFDMRLHSKWLSTGPQAAPTHWSQVFFPLEQPLQTTAGDTLKLRMKRPQYGQWSWVTSHRDTVFRQSTLRSQPLRPADLQKLSNAHIPQHNQQGEIAAWVLGNMGEGKSVAELECGLAAAFPGRFVTPGDSARVVRGLLERYSR